MSETKAKQTKATKAAMPEIKSALDEDDELKAFAAQFTALSPARNNALVSARNNALVKIRADIALAMLSHELKGDVIAMRGTTPPEKVIERYRWFYDRLDFIESPPAFDDGATGTEG